MPARQTRRGPGSQQRGVCTAAPTPCTRLPGGRRDEAPRAAAAAEAGAADSSLPDEPVSGRNGGQAAPKIKRTLRRPAFRYQRSRGSASAFFRLPSSDVH